MKQNDVESIKRMADVVMDQIPFPVNSIGYKIALIMIKLNGYYTYTDSMNMKVFICLAKSNMKQIDLFPISRKPAWCAGKRGIG